MLIRAVEAVEPIPYVEGVKKRVVIGPKEGASNYVMRVFDVLPGQRTMSHAHDFEHEVLILSGEGAVVDGQGRMMQVKPLDAIFIPANEKHSLKNTGNDTFSFVCIVPTWGEDSL